jgi:hypothetical protein
MRQPLCGRRMLVQLSRDMKFPSICRAWQLLEFT